VSELAARLALIAGLAVLTSCHKPPPTSGAVSSAGSSGAPTSLAPEQEKRTTDGRIAVGNLNAQISSAERLLDGSRRSFALNSLVPLLEARAQFTGHPEDYDRALRYADELIRTAPDGNAYLSRAAVRSSLHLFQPGLADLDEAEKLGMGRAKIEPARAGTLHAMGHTKEALPLQQRLTKADPSIGTLGALAVMLGDLGQRDQADVLFQQAPRVYRDVSPFPVAWIEFQQGQMWERGGQVTKARAAYEAAVARLPVYATAQAHLAGLQAATGDRDGAIARLRQVVSGSTDPEFVGQLASLLDEVGHPDEAGPLKAKARQDFEALLLAHPEAFADHAARFYLGAGGDAAHALLLAKLNLRNRTTPEAFDLALTAALEAKDAPSACATADQARKELSPLPTPHLEFLTRKADEACGRGSGH
jgi:tetratricopeptide (TPR) repeat protein